MIASDFDQTINDSKLQPRSEYVKSLLLLKLAGHQVFFFSSRSDPNVSQLYRRLYLPRFADELQLSDADKNIILADDFFETQHKLSWEQVVDGDHIDLVLDDDPKVEWCNFSVHLVPETDGFDTFVQAVLANPDTRY